MQMNSDFACWIQHIVTEHFCYLSSLPDDRNLVQKSEAIFIGWMITFIKSDQLPQIWESSVFHVPDG